MAPNDILMLKKLFNNKTIENCAFSHTFSPPTTFIFIYSLWQAYKLSDPIRLKPTKSFSVKVPSPFLICPALRRH